MKSKAKKTTANQIISRRDTVCLQEIINNTYNFKVSPANFERLRTEFFFNSKLSFNWSKIK